MFCSQCGAKAGGKFCSQCGTALAAAEEPKAVLPADWSHEVHYDVLMQVPEIRERVRRHADLAPRRLSGEDLFAIYDKVMSSPVPMQKVAVVAQNLYGAMGIATGKHRTEMVPAPAGRALVRALCSLARNGQKLRTVRQADDGCVLEACLPSDMFSLEGDLLVTVRRHGSTTEVEAVTKIKGQLYDWGKSRRCLDRLYADLQSDAA